MNVLEKGKRSQSVLVIILLICLILITSLYVREFYYNILLQANLKTWVQFAANTSAFDDYAKNQKGYYQINDDVKPKTIIGSREGYPIRAWSLPSNPEDHAQQFVNNYNEEMEKLINSEKDKSK